MTLPDTEKVTNNLPIETSGVVQHSSSGMRRIFYSADGMRSGWRLLIFFALVLSEFLIVILIRFHGLQGFAQANRHTGPTTLTPSGVAGTEFIQLAIIGIAAWVMSRIEHRKFSKYGLPLRLVFGKNFLLGLCVGFAGVSATLFTIFLLHGFRLTGLALHGLDIPLAMAEWAGAFLLVGLFEEFLARGYVLHTLASGIGFWPAALSMSFLFGLAHYFNPGETAIGAASAGSFGLLACLLLKRTGNLWVPVGFHAAWDWGQAFYGVPDSGLLSYHSVWNSAFHGPSWLTGGTVGPEASVVCLITLVVVALVFSRFSPSKSVA